jgi:restriction endonuclease Mrr
MTIPDYQTLMLPLLKLASDDEEHSILAWFCPHRATRRFPSGAAQK